MARMVKCYKLGRELPGLDRPPVPGELGKRIFEQISKDAWDQWKAQSVLLINHYGLNLLDAEAQKFLREQMERFLFADEARMPEGWTPEGSEPEPAGASKGDPAAPTKGGGPPQQKK
ncbi:MAG: oxidative damage protection protein [Chloroflexi bacterium]|nr:oxidative damage protection protein [Chloroflexota bacterium]MBI3733779.1 oxidative damage protection protein [Chloroflexota bacterium]